MGVRESLESAFEQVTGGGDAATGPVSPDTGGEASVSPPQVAVLEGDAADASGAANAGDAAADGGEASGGRPRDEKGRFAPKAKEPEAQAKPEAPKEVAANDNVEAAPAAPVEPPPAPVVEAIKPPQSWKPQAREHFAKLPPEVQQEVDRREKEISRALQDSAPDRKLAAEFKEAVQPYMAMIQAEGGTPTKAVASLLQTAAALRTAPPTHRAQLIAQMVKTFGVPIEALDQALAGETPQGQPQQIDPEAIARQAEERVFQSLQQRQQAALASHAQREIEAFTQKAEFFEDVRETVADMMEIAAKRGRKLSLEDAYKQATMLHPEISQVLKQREAAEAAKANVASTQRAQRAAVSVKTQPASVTPEAPSSIRGALEAAFAKAESGKR